MDDKAGAESKKRTMADLYAFAQKQPEMIPSDVTEFFLRRSGFQCDDPVVVKIISMAAQKFITDLAKESYAFGKKRMQPTAGTAQQQQKSRQGSRNVLLLEDVANAAAKFGVRVNKPEYLADTPNAGLEAPAPPQPVAHAAAPVAQQGEKRPQPSGPAAGAGARKKKKN